MKTVQFKQKQLETPIIQGGMGIGISLGNLAGHVMKEGAMGCISLAMPGYNEPDFYTQTMDANRRALQREVLKARELSNGKGLLAVNIMVAGNRYDEFVQMAVDNEVDAIISGAGLPLKLPEYVQGKCMIAPIVSSGRAARVILKQWDSRYGCTADFIVIEGVEAGGHLGFKKEEIEAGADNLAILADVLDQIKPFEEKYGVKIPVFVAGGIFTHIDIVQALNAGASGVQIATRFIATKECDASDAFKQAIIKANQVQIIDSPAGLPGRAIVTPFLEEIKKGRIAPTKCVNCLQTCNPATTPYCICQALIRAVSQEVDSGLVFAGSNVTRIHEITTVKELIHELMEGENA